LTRRDLLCGSASLAVAAVMPGRVSAASDDAGPVMAKLCSYMSGAGDRALPPAVAEQAKSHILDTLAAMISGSELPPGRHALEFARTAGGDKIALLPLRILFVDRLKPRSPMVHWLKLMRPTTIIAPAALIRAALSYRLLWRWARGPGSMGHASCAR
jgi:hypothetical protein